ncbi:MAG: N-acetylneuraminate synthase [Bacteroidales bacterium]|nr:N-acetylneuraminate synthase [Bacteroidales bacterium]
MNKKVIIIAEAGVNHNGSLQRAKEMVKAAKAAGADYVKFQTAIPELVISSFAPKAEYQKETTDSDQSQLDMCKAIHLPLTDYTILKSLCESEGIGFMSTPFDLVSIDLLAELGQDWMKVPSGEITNLPYLRKIAAAGIPVILSTGMSTIDEIIDAVEILTGQSKKYPTESKLTKEDIILLHCNTEYPTPFCDVNLSAMDDIRRATGLRVGYSDHTVGIEVPIAAVALGAIVIEKHFTLDCNLPGPDHKASLEPDQLAAMVKAIRNIEQSIGSGEKTVSQSERKNMAIARKSIVAAKDIAKGEILTEDNITIKRPGNGVSPMKWDDVIGMVAIKDFKYDQLIEI